MSPDPLFFSARTINKGVVGTLFDNVRDIELLRLFGGGMKTHNVASLSIRYKVVAFSPQCRSQACVVYGLKRRLPICLLELA